MTRVYYICIKIKFHLLVNLCRLFKWMCVFCTGPSSILEHWRIKLKDHMSLIYKSFIGILLCQLTCNFSTSFSDAQRTYCFNYSLWFLNRLKKFKYYYYMTCFSFRKQNTWHLYHSLWFIVVYSIETFCVIVCFLLWVGVGLMNNSIAVMLVNVKLQCNVIVTLWQNCHSILVVIGQFDFIF